MEDTLGYCLVQCAGSGTELSLSCILVACFNRSVELADLGADCGANCLVTQTSLLVGLVTLDLRLDVCHRKYLLNFLVKVVYKPIEECFSRSFK